MPLRWPTGKVPFTDPRPGQIGRELRTIHAWAEQAGTVPEFLEHLVAAGFAAAGLRAREKALLCADLWVQGAAGEHLIRLDGPEGETTLPEIRAGVARALRGHDLDAGCTGITPDFAEEFMELLAGAFQGKDSGGQVLTKEDLEELLGEALRLVKGAGASPESSWDEMLG